jgi:hypothetical protein
VDPEAQQNGSGCSSPDQGGEHCFDVRTENPGIETIAPSATVLGINVSVSCGKRDLTYRQSAWKSLCPELLKKPAASFEFW